MYTKTIICLANSKKTSGRCVAGKEFNGADIGDWIRPVSNSETHEISYNDRRYHGDGGAEVLDIIEVPLLKAVPTNHQSENHLIAADRYWRKVGQADWPQVQGALDDVEGPLWINEESTQNGQNDKVAEDRLDELDSSLKLITVASLKLIVALESGFQGSAGKRKIRGSFRHNRRPYTLAVTDPVIEAEYRAKTNGEYEIGPAILCVSLGEAWKGYAYKLIATVILREAVD